MCNLRAGPILGRIGCRGTLVQKGERGRLAIQEPAGWPGASGTDGRQEHPEFTRNPGVLPFLPIDELPEPRRILTLVSSHGRIHVTSCINMDRSPACGNRRLQAPPNTSFQLMERQSA